jgi:hypothetical protein
MALRGSAGDQIALKPPAPSRIVGSRDIVAENRDIGNVVRQILELDHELYHARSHPFIGSFIQWDPIFEQNPDTWRAMLSSDDHLVGYWQIASLKPAVFARAKRGDLSACDFTVDCYQPLTQPGVYNLYFVSICLDPKYRSLQNQLALIESFFGVCQDLANRGVFFEEVAAVAHSEDGHRLCVVFGLDRVGDALDHGDVFQGRFARIVRNAQRTLLRRFPALIQHYAE